MNCLGLSILSEEDATIDRLVRHAADHLDDDRRVAHLDDRVNHSAATDGMAVGVN